MANGERHHHLIISSEFTESEQFRSPRSGSSSKAVPELNRAQQSRSLMRQFGEAWETAIINRQVQEEQGMEDGWGLQVGFESFPDVDFAFERLARERSGIELYNVKKIDNAIRATVFVPYEKLGHFVQLIQDYLFEKRDSIGRKRDNQKLIDAINNIRVATVEALWTDHEELPSNAKKAVWWEAWLVARGGDREVLREFRRLTEAQDIRVQSGELVFPERIVVLIRASLEQLQRSMHILNRVAELRYPKETADFFDDLTTEEQSEWLQELLDRTKFASDGDQIPYVSLLDTGVNRGHPLLAPALSQKDMHTVEPGWGGR